MRSSRLAWSPPAVASHANSTPPQRTPVARSNRVLVADDDTTRVYDLRQVKWNAVISNGSGGMGKNVHVEFGSTEDDVIVFSDFASKATVWCLRTGRTVEIRDPKFSGRDSRGWGYRPSLEGKGKVLGILCRSVGQDILLLLAPRTHHVIARVELPTVDAAGMKWSRDGRWIAVWDAASSGYHLHIYTADGHLYRTIAREPSDEMDTWAFDGLGIKSVEWAPGNQWLAVGGWDRRVRILSTRTFAPQMFLDHTSPIHVPSAPVYTELVDGRGLRSYTLTQQPLTPPRAPSEKGDSMVKEGISILAFNSDGTMCATRDDSTPTTIWIWDLPSLRPQVILIQYAAVKSLQWHPSNPSLLLVQSTHDSPTLYLYTTPPLSASANLSTPGPPEIIDLSESISKLAGTAPSKWDGRWLATAGDKKPVLVLGHQQGYVLAWPEGKELILRFENEDEEHSDDSLYDILTGRTPIPRLHHHETADEDGEMDDSADFEGVTVDDTQEGANEDSTGEFEDTFREKRKDSTSARQESGFDESGMDEMF